MTTRRIAYFLRSSNVYIVACEATFYKIDWIIDKCIEVMVNDIDCHKNGFNNAEDEMKNIGLDKFIKLLPKDKLFNLCLASLSRVSGNEYFRKSLMKDVKRLKKQNEELKRYLVNRYDG